jgi:hypothetical protein
MSTRRLAVCVPLLAACSASSADPAGPPPIEPPFTACASEWFFGDNSRPDASSVYLYDQDGWTRIERLDGGRDGSVDFEARAHLHGDRWERYEEWTADASGELALSFRQSWTYDGDELVAVEVDDDGDGYLAYRWVYLYEDGRIDQAQFDAAGDGSIEAVEHRVYDEAGQLVAQHLWADGRLHERVTVYTHDAEGRMLTMERDRDLDGAVDLLVEQAYDAHGYRARRVEHWLDDSEYRWEQRWQHTAERLLRRDSTNEQYGEVTSRSHTIYHHECS